MAVKKVKKPVKAMKKVSATASSKKATAASSKKAGPVSKQFTKSEILGTIAEHTGLAQKQIGTVFEALNGVIERHLKKGGPGIFVLPGLLKVQIIHKPATKSRKGRNPFTGEEMTFKAKPARNVVKVKALKGLKEMV
jgi:nucleoid DNA-binding protein